MEEKNKCSLEKRAFIPKHTQNAVEMIQVIRIFTVVGKGTDEDPIRQQFEYWDTDGELLFILGAKRSTITGELEQDKDERFRLFGIP